MIGDSSNVYFDDCVVCGSLFATKWNTQKCCSQFCQKKYSRISHTKLCRKIRGIKKQETTCTYCGDKLTIYTHPDNIGKNRFCPNSKCRERHKRDKRRVRKSRNYIEPVSIREIYFRDKGKCQHCGKKLKLSHKVPHLLAPVRDHITPLSQGGEHSKRNVQLLCFSCNSKKGCGTVLGGEQLRLFG